MQVEPMIDLERPLRKRLLLSAKKGFLFFPVCHSADKERKTNRIKYDGSSFSMRKIVHSGCFD